MQLDLQIPPYIGCSISSLLGLLRILVILYVITDYGNMSSCTSNLFEFTISSLYGISDKLNLY